MKRFISFLLLTMVTAAQAHTYKYTDLIIRDYDEMFNQVQSRIKKARAIAKPSEEGSDDREVIEQLRDALKLIMSRPNSDNMVAKLTPEVRRELVNYSAFEDTVASLAAEALASVKDKNAAVVQRSTNLFVLENILNEVRPEVAGNEDMKRMVKRIADAEIEIDKDVIKDRKIRSMFKTQNPSEMAKDILKTLPKQDDKKGAAKK